MGTRACLGGFLVALGFLFLGYPLARAEKIVVSQLDAVHAEAREKAFLPWQQPNDSYASWLALSPGNITVYSERKAGGWIRDIYLPRNGVGYRVLNGLSHQELLAEQRDQARLGYILLGAALSHDDQGVEHYWTLWVRQDQAAPVKEEMRKLGITPARIEPSLGDAVAALSACVQPHAGMFALLALAVGGLNFLLLLLLVARAWQGGRSNAR